MSAKGPMSAIQRGVARVVGGLDLSRDSMTVIVREIIEGQATAAQVGGLLVGLAAKGETSDEIVGAAAAMREAVIPIETTRTPLIDTCGTGGSGIARRN
ncbi:MAG TPA: anthranilate phosphoribosyltransferase, partial [Nannocystis exedens]|nr:anthranilate phosphoribosyltransferase [Nannocystis exedens]